MPRRALAATCLLVPLGALAACSADAPAPAAPPTSTPATSGASAAGGDRLAIVTTVYPLYYAAQRVGGDKADVVNLTKPGAEPHDLELTPADVATIDKADLVVYEKGLQPEVDDAVAQRQGKGVLDVASMADLEALQTQVIGGDGHSADDGHDHGDLDPHFWLDPLRYQKVVQGISTQLGGLSQADKMTFEDNTTALSKELTTLDGDYQAGLRTCTSKTIVTSHAAFGYLAARYGLTQVAVSGLTPDGEPDPARIAQVTDYVRANKVSTIYSEPLVSAAVAQTVAKEAGINTAVLDPLEGITDASAGKDYLEVMRSNLATLQKGQGCS